MADADVPVAAQASDPRPLRSGLDALLERWLVQFNPLYVASAALVLAGAWQLSAGLAERRLADGRILPLLILSAYEGLLVGAAWLLARREHVVRPAVILALIATLLLLDPTDQLNAIAIDASRGVGLLVAAGAVLLVPLLLLPLLRALRVRAAAESLAAPTAVVLGIALGPQLLDSELLPRDCALLTLIGWGLGLTVWMVRRPLRLELEDPAADAWAHTVRDRLARVLPIAWILAYWAHVIGWSVVFDVLPGAPATFLAACALLLAARSEPNVWLGAGIASLLAYADGARCSEAALLLAVLLLVRLWVGPRATGTSRRLLVGAVLELWLAAAAWGWRGGPFPGATPVVTLAAIALLVVLAVRERSSLTAGPALFLCFATRWPELPEIGLGALGRGALLLTAGFLALAVGVLANVRLARRRPPPS